MKTKKKKKRSLSQTFYEIRCDSTKITKKQFLLANSTAVNTNLGVLGLDLHSSSPKPVNFFGAQSSLGAQFSFGGTSSHLGGHSPGMPPVALGLFQEREVWGSNLEPVKSDTVLPRLATGATFLQKELCCSGAVTRRWASQTRYTCFSVIQRVSWTIWFWFDEVKWYLKSQAQKMSRSWEKIAQLSTLKIS